ncbi:MAG: hypothetical protein GF310_14940 [candidate division Zixibacteria bacterium]|nr:hypothetical protein [candidate division Zixibacteria bacterium]
MVFLNILEESLLITGFVGLMMLIIEYVNVRTRGAWQKGLYKHKWIQYIIAVLLGATPGCFGAFAVVAMFSHRTVTFGALVAAMIATSGDEAFVMFAMFPGKAFFLTAVLIVIALAAGWLTDLLCTRKNIFKLNKFCQFELHDPEYCDGIPEESFVKQWVRLNIFRAFSCAVLLIFIVSVLAGIIGPDEWNWQRIAVLIFGIIGFFIAAYAPDHFLRVHLWRHVIRRHIPSIFLWTFGALVVSYFIVDQLHLEESIQANTSIVIVFASLLGIIPESGPHLLFVTLYAKGTVPFAVLLASSIVQDGHGMLPLLAHSRKGFVLVKAVNLVLGLAIGLIVYFIL